MLKIEYSPKLILKDDETVKYDWWKMVYTVSRKNVKIRKGKIILWEVTWEELLPCTLKSGLKDRKEDMRNSRIKKIG